MIKKYNADDFSARDILETTKVLDRLYGRLVAKKYFTAHVNFDTIKLT